ncbi:MAG: ribonuclease P protein component [Phycisphaeraceae bacterium]|nr:ribonuclease P protein component [Phycisphaerales bacterium]MCB9860421.1 ribonuclease P protein component [Phycisphaeraceae bacterium]
MNTVDHNQLKQHADEPRSFVFRARHRLSRNRDYQHVFASRARKPHGAIVVFAAPNTLDHHRLGLSVGRRVGNAVKRNRIKRLLREVFRHEHASIPLNTNGTGYDFIVQVRQHELQRINGYRESFTRAANALHALWNKRLRTEDDS